MKRMYQYGPITYNADFFMSFFFFFWRMYELLQLLYGICMHQFWFVFCWGIPQIQSDWILPCHRGLDCAS